MISHNICFHAEIRILSIFFFFFFFFFGVCGGGGGGGGGGGSKIHLIWSYE